MRSRLMAAVLALPLPLLSAACAEDEKTPEDTGEEAVDVADMTPTDLPAELVAPEGETLTFVADASGDQIYDCTLADTTYAWTFRAPDATLYMACADGDDGCDPEEIVGTHYAGPTWESTSGSTVVGAKEAEVASSDPDAVAWLRLSAVSNSGEGPFAAVKTIQRLYTAGGKAPATGCDATTVDTEHDAPYTATYYFYE